MHHTAAKLKELFARIAIAAVLLNGIFHCLFGETVFQFKGSNRQAANKQAQIQRAARLIGTVGQLTRDGEAV